MSGVEDEDRPPGAAQHEGSTQSGCSAAYDDNFVVVENLLIGTHLS